MAPALARVRDLQATPLGPVLDTPLLRGNGTEESALANLFADAIRAVAPVRMRPSARPVDPADFARTCRRGPRRLARSTTRSRSTTSWCGAR